jgi:aminomethyltransferase
MDTQMKHTPLHDVHRALGARIVAFGGWEMPVWYEGISAEHQAVRTRVGLFDVSHMGEFVIYGSGALAFLRRMLTNDAAALSPNQAHYTLMPNERGGTVDDLLLYRLAEDVFLTVVNAANIDKDRVWLESNLSGEVKLADRSPETALLALQGPLALSVLSELTALPLAEMGYYHFSRGEVAGAQALVSRTGYTGEDGFEIMIAAEDAVSVWTALMDRGTGYDIRPIGLGARDSLRLEAAMALYGHELDDDTSALEAGLGYFVKLDKPELMGLERLRREKAEGVPRKLVGLQGAGDGIPRQGYPIEADGQAIGVITSGTLSPTLGVPIAMGYVPPAYAAVDTALAVAVRGRLVPVTVVKRPFYRRSDRG